MRRRAFAALAIGGAVVAPMSATAQQPGKVWRLAIAAQAGPIDTASGKRLRVWTALLDELRRLGHVEGESLAVSWFSSEGSDAYVAGLAREIGAQKPDVVFTPDVRMA